MKHGKHSLYQKRIGRPLGGQSKGKSLSPSIDESRSQGEASVFSSGKLSTTPSSTLQDGFSFSRLKSDQQFYLNYHRQFINYGHYFFKHDPSGFLQNELIRAALAYDPLLYALVGFSAFHFALAQGNGKLTDFLGYYNKSMSLLRKELQSSREPTESTIFTILLLATFEVSSGNAVHYPHPLTPEQEYLGDWVNLTGHQKAAYEIIKKLYTPDTIVKSEIHWRILIWYGRFDLFVGPMAGENIVLSRELFYVHEKHPKDLSDSKPNDISIKIESLYAHQRVLVCAWAQLLAKVSKGEISIPDFYRESEAFLQKIAAWKAQIDEFRSFSDCFVMDFDGAPPIEPDGIVNPYIPGRIFKDALYVVNYLMIDCITMEISHKYQSSLILQQSLPPEILDLSLELCQLFEAIELWPGSPRGAILPLQASLGLNCLVLPREGKYISWCKKKLVKMENLGYVYRKTPFTLPL